MGLNLVSRDIVKSIVEDASFVFRRLPHPSYGEKFIIYTRIGVDDEQTSIYQKLIDNFGLGNVIQEKTILTPKYLTGYYYIKGERVDV